MPRLSSPRATRSELFATLGLVGAAVVFVLGRPVVRSFSDHPSSELCEAMLERYVEHVVYAIDPKPNASELAAKKAQARALAAEDQAFARCPTYLTRAEAECAMHANNADELERCLP